MRNALFFITLSTLLILVCLEAFAHFLLKSKGESFPLFYQYNSQKFTLPWDGEHSAYHKVDPLLGWGIHSKEIVKNGYVLKNDCIFLENKIQSANPLVIYISGGSTSDLVYDPNNWPVYLNTLLEEHKIYAHIYVAAVGGYNSGQELLKTIRDIEFIQPDIHISYSGANESEDPSYTSFYEQNFFEKALGKNQILLPNTVEMLSRLISNPDTELELAIAKRWNADEFWEKNIKMMHSIGLQNDAAFLAILQPVKGQDSTGRFLNQSDEKTSHLVEDNQAFYPAAKKIAQEEAYAFDFTNIFGLESGEVFIDDCHIASPKHQQMISWRVFDLIDSIRIKNEVMDVDLTTPQLQKVK